MSAPRASARANAESFIRFLLGGERLRGAVSFRSFAFKLSSLLRWRGVAQLVELPAEQSADEHDLAPAAHPRIDAGRGGVLLAELEREDGPSTFGRDFEAQCVGPEAILGRFHGVALDDHHRSEGAERLDQPANRIPAPASPLLVDPRALLTHRRETCAAFFERDARDR